MKINELETDEAIKAVTAMETIEELREAANSVELKFSGNTGEATLRTKLFEYLDAKSEEEGEVVPGVLKEGENEEIVIAKIPEKAKGPTIEEMLEMDPNEVEDVNLRRQVIRSKALRLHRVRITNLDPADAQLNGAIISTYNKYTGKVAKYVPFGEESENGYHLPEIILKHLKNQKFPLRKEIKGGSFGVKKYKTTMVPKFAIEELPLLTKKELAELAAHQRASNAIDK